MTPEEAFHAQRIMFVIGSTLQFSGPGDTRSHAQWLKEDYGIEQPMLRGFVDATGLYFYSTEDCRATTEDYKMIKPWILREIGEYLDLDENTPIHMGMIPGEIGVRWQPAKTLGTFKSLGL